VCIYRCYTSHSRDAIRPRPRVTQSFFMVRAVILIKHQLFFMNSSILQVWTQSFWHTFSGFFAQSFCYSKLNHFSDISHFFTATMLSHSSCRVIFCCHAGKLFLNAHCSVIFHYYNTQSFFTATVLSHSSCKRSSVIFRYYSTQSFFIATVLSHFLMLQHSVIPDAAVLSHFSL
jgi:hypothetical protein